KQIDQKIKFAEIELSGLNALGSKALERAAHEESIRQTIKEQAGEIERADASYEQAETRSRARLAAEKEIRDEQQRTREEAIKADVETGRLSAGEGIVESYKLQSEGIQKNLEASRTANAEAQNLITNR